MVFTTRSRILNQLKFALGTRLQFSRFDSDDSVGNESDGSDIGISLFGRYYFTPQKRFSFYGEVYAGYTKRESEANFLSTSLLGQEKWMVTATILLYLRGFSFLFRIN